MYQGQWPRKSTKDACSGLLLRKRSFVPIQRLIGAMTATAIKRAARDLKIEVNVGLYR